MRNFNNFFNCRINWDFLFFKSLNNLKFFCNKVLYLSNFNQFFNLNNLISEDLYCCNLIICFFNLYNFFSVSFDSFYNFFSERNRNNLLNECLDNVVNLNEMWDNFFESMNLRNSDNLFNYSLNLNNSRNFNNLFYNFFNKFFNLNNLIYYFNYWD
jgi:hypothetical protein